MKTYKCEVTLLTDSGTCGNTYVVLEMDESMLYEMIC